MRLTTKSRYAVTAMLELALHKEKGPITLGELSEKLGISLSYLEQLFAALRAKGLVRGVRGPGGGYHLSRKPKDISIADIICATDEWVEHTHAKKRQANITTPPNSGRDLWEDLSYLLLDFLNEISLHDVVIRDKMTENTQDEDRIAA